MTTPKFNNKINEHIIIHVESNNKIFHKDVWISRSVAVVGVVFALNEDGYNVLIVKRSDKMDEGGKYCLPCGYLDWDETGFESVTREIHEETSLYTPDYEKFLYLNNKEQPCFIQTDPTKDKNQNVSLVYIMVYNFYDNILKFPNDIVKYKNEETAEVQWLNLTDLEDLKKYNWAFNHDLRIIEALKYNKSLII
jgi:ADP-ribose pyrophosphatase YjhB (NUDIX family)